MNLLLLAGGLFLIFKSTREMHLDIGGMEEKRAMVAKSTLAAAILQVVIVGFVFSFDSILTAVGLSNQIPVMLAAVVVSMIVMLLVAESMGFHIPKGYIYFAFGFSIGVEVLNTMAKKKREKRVTKTAKKK